MINNGQIVCQDEEIQSEQKDGDSEFHFAINKSENQIEYSSCTITPNGEIYYYESFVWEKGKGLQLLNQRLFGKGSVQWLNDALKQEIFLYSEEVKGEISLVQMWFKEIGREVYTCCLYHASDYNYVLNIFLLEEDKIKRVRTDMICLQRQFALREGEVYHY